MSMAFKYVPPKIDGRAALATAVPAATHAAAEHLLDVSRELVPVDTETLRDSGHLEPNGESGWRVAYEAWNFDESVPYPYGIRIHEDLELEHPNGGQAKFLEMPMHNERATMAEIAAAELEKAFRA